MTTTRQLTAAIYARVSSEDQNYQMQLVEVRQYAERMGWLVVEYAEKMSSVKKRPVLDRMMTDARLKKIDVVLVWKLDRFGRSLANLVQNILLLDTYGVRFVAVTQGSIPTRRIRPRGCCCIFWARWRNSSGRLSSSACARAWRKRSGRASTAAGR